MQATPTLSFSEDRFYKKESDSQTFNRVAKAFETDNFFPTFPYLMARKALEKDIAFLPTVALDRILKQFFLQFCDNIHQKKIEKTFEIALE